jgi:hypothetical protein
MESEREACQQMIKQLNDSTVTFGELHKFYTNCLLTIQGILITHARNEAQHLQELAEGQVASRDEYRIVEQKHQFTSWEKWSREEQIANSIGTDEASAVTGECSIPKYCFLKLKKK